MDLLNARRREELSKEPWVTLSSRLRPGRDLSTAVQTNPKRLHMIAALKDIKKEIKEFSEEINQRYEEFSFFLDAKLAECKSNRKKVGNISKNVKDYETTDEISNDTKSETIATLKQMKHDIKELTGKCEQQSGSSLLQLEAVQGLNNKENVRPVSKNYDIKNDERADVTNLEAIAIVKQMKLEFKELVERFNNQNGSSFIYLEPVEFLNDKEKIMHNSKNDKDSEKTDEKENDTKSETIAILKQMNHEIKELAEKINQQGSSFLIQPLPVEHINRQKMTGDISKKIVDTETTEKANDTKSETIAFLMQMKHEIKKLAEKFNHKNSSSLIQLKPVKYINHQRKTAHISSNIMDSETIYERANDTNSETMAILTQMKHEIRELSEKFNQQSGSSLIKPEPVELLNNKEMNGKISKNVTYSETDEKVININSEQIATLKATKPMNNESAHNFHQQSPIQPEPVETENRRKRIGYISNNVNDSEAVKEEREKKSEVIVTLKETKYQFEEEAEKFNQHGGFIQPKPVEHVDNKENNIKNISLNMKDSEDDEKVNTTSETTGTVKGMEHKIKETDGKCNQCSGPSLLQPEQADPVNNKEKIGDIPKRITDPDINVKLNDTRSETITTLKGMKRNGMDEKFNQCSINSGLIKPKPVQSVNDKETIYNVFKNMKYSETDEEANGDSSSETKVTLKEIKQQIKELAEKVNQQHEIFSFIQAKSDLADYKTADPEKLINNYSESIKHFIKSDEEKLKKSTEKVLQNDFKGLVGISNLEELGGEFSSFVVAKSHSVVGIVTNNKFVNNPNKLVDFKSNKNVDKLKLEQCTVNQNLKELVAANQQFSEFSLIVPERLGLVEHKVCKLEIANNRKGVVDFEMNGKVHDTKLEDFAGPKAREREYEEQGKEISSYFVPAKSISLIGSVVLQNISKNVEDSKLIAGKGDNSKLGIDCDELKKKSEMFDLNQVVSITDKPSDSNEQNSEYESELIITEIDRNFDKENEDTSISEVKQSLSGDSQAHSIKFDDNKFITSEIEQVKNYRKIQANVFPKKEIKCSDTSNKHDLGFKVEYKSQIIVNKEDKNKFLIKKNNQQIINKETETRERSQKIKSLLEDLLCGSKLTVKPIRVIEVHDYLKNCQKKEEKGKKYLKVKKCNRFQENPVASANCENTEGYNGSFILKKVSKTIKKQPIMIDPDIYENIIEGPQNNIMLKRQIITRKDKKIPRIEPKGNVVSKNEKVINNGSLVIKNLQNAKNLKKVKLHVIKKGFTAKNDRKISKLKSSPEEPMMGDVNFEKSHSVTKNKLKEESRNKYSSNEKFRNDELPIIHEFLKNRKNSIVKTLIQERLEKITSGLSVMSGTASKNPRHESTSENPCNISKNKNKSKIYDKVKANEIEKSVDDESLTGDTLNRVKTCEKVVARINFNADKVLQP